MWKSTNIYQWSMCYTYTPIYRVSRYQKGKTKLDFAEARDSEWQWHQLGHMRSKSAPRSTQITTSAPHHTVSTRYFARRSLLSKVGVRPRAPDTHTHTHAHTQRTDCEYGYCANTVGGVA